MNIICVDIYVLRPCTYYINVLYKNFEAKRLELVLRIRENYAKVTPAR